MKLARVAHPPGRALKFRQAAIAYLHYAILYEFGAWALLERGLFPSTRGPEWLWFIMGAAIAAAVIWALWSWQSAWLARAVWALVAFRLPTLIEGAFFGGNLDVPQGLYLAAALVFLANIWMLARSAWDV